MNPRRREFALADAALHGFKPRSTDSVSSRRKCQRLEKQGGALLSPLRFAATDKAYSAEYQGDNSDREPCRRERAYDNRLVRLVARTVHG